MSAKRETCASKDKSVCDYNEFRRLRYFHGMLLDDSDFQAEQEYHAGKRRMLNRMLHGSGVVCGLDLKGKKDGQWVEVTSGLALDCSGNEIWVPRKEKVDLAALLPPKDTGDKPAECKEDDDKGDVKTYYIGIRYDEKPSNPVSVYLPSGSCDERTCENSRYKEGFCIEIVDCCSEKYDDGFLKKFCECGDKYESDPDKLPLCRKCGDQTVTQLCQCQRLEEFCEQSVPCPECCSCDKPCHVILGQIQVNIKECRLVSLCMNECRRYVLTGRMFQHMLTGILAGGEKYFNMVDASGKTMVDASGKKIQIPDVGELANNPIKALCWLLQYKVIEGGKFEVNLCDVPKKDENQETAAKITALESRMERADKDNLALRGTLETVIASNKLILKPADAGQPEEKQPPAKTPKAPK